MVRRVARKINDDRPVDHILTLVACLSRHEGGFRALLRREPGPCADLHLLIDNDATPADAKVVANPLF